MNLSQFEKKAYTRFIKPWLFVESLYLYITDVVVYPLPFCSFPEMTSEGGIDDSELQFQLMENIEQLTDKKLVN